MTDPTEHAVLNAARAVQALAADIQTGGGSGGIGARLYVTLGAVAGAARSINALAEDLRNVIKGMENKS